MIPDYTESNFAGIEHGDGISVIRFYAPCCEPCRRSEQEFARILGRRRLLSSHKPYIMRCYSMTGM